MKLLVVDDDGQVIGQIDDLESYDLEKSIARASLCSEVAEILAGQKST